MRVIHVIHSARFGGIRTLVRDLVDQQSRRKGIEIAVLFAQLDGEPPADFAKIGIAIYNAGLTSGYDISPMKIIQICKIFRQYDIIHFHFFNPLFSMSAILIGQPKIVYTFHGLFGFSRKRTIADIVKDFLLSSFLRFSVDFISYNSNFTKKTAQNRFQIRHKRDKVIYNGLVLSAVAGNRANIAGSTREKLQFKFVVAGFGRFVQMKRFDRLIAAFAEFQKGKSDTVLLLVGDSVLKNALAEQAKRLNVAEQTIFTGFQHNVHDYQDAADVCVMSSEKEAFGLVAVEALAQGLPVIAFADGGGVVEVVGGYSMDDIVQDVDGLVRRLDFYYRRKPEQTDEGKKRKRYAQRFSMQHSESEFFEAYKTICGL